MNFIADLEIQLCWPRPIDANITVKLDGTVIADSPATCDLGVSFHYQFDDNDLRDHRIEIELSGTIPHAWAVELVKLKIDDADLTHYCKHSGRVKYRTDQADGIFGGIMGQQGVVTLDFATPVYLWLKNACTKLL